MSPPPVLRLAGDIAAQFRHLPDEQAAAKVADHIGRFWDPRMREHLRELVAADEQGCDPVVARAATLLAKPRV